MIQRLCEFCELPIKFCKLVLAEIGVLIKIGVSVRKIARVQVLHVAVAVPTKICLSRLGLVSLEHDEAVLEQALIRYKKRLPIRVLVLYADIEQIG